MCLLCASPCPSFLSPLWGHCRARPCSWSRGALEAPAGPAAGHWPSRPLCSCPARAYTAPPCLAFSPLPCLPVVPASHRPSPEWACGCRWTPLWPRARRTASLTQLVANFNDGMERGLQPLGKGGGKIQLWKPHELRANVFWPVSNMFLHSCSHQQEAIRLFSKWRN